uniref:Retrotransposon protein, putative, unclassified n=1 Tax=Oryza sativa subsp. japonica TaxID=39947 RepID=Q339E5_ORYSJ|nr:retrotransposon protein, putative, unclassified [Oryza sativa Japonica Group]
MGKKLALTRSSPHAASMIVVWTWRDSEGLTLPWYLSVRLGRNFGGYPTFRRFAIKTWPPALSGEDAGGLAPCLGWRGTPEEAAPSPALAVRRLSRQRSKEPQKS